ncbi:MAG: S-layer homology domain-containing protein [Stigonema ocellatum SAG 48.90 = DSM 106950]|nr:S-layer homology domain-containing protein [Stigonema ocellatum SAG 48.90 = DSM 106950]
MVLCKRPAILVSLAVLLTSLTACANSPVAKKFQQSLAADPRLKENPVTFSPNQVDQQQKGAKVQLPADFPQDIPLYQNANLQEVKPASSEDGSVLTRWLSSDPSNIIASYYQQQFQANNWQIVQQPTDQQGGVLEARHNDLQVKVSVQPKSATNPASNEPQTATELLIEYVRNATATTQTTPTPNAQATTPQTTPTPNTQATTPTPNTQATNNTATQPSDPQLIAPVSPKDSTTQPSSTSEPKNSTVTPESQEFSDVNKAPQELRQYIQDLATLGVLPLESNAAKSNSSTKNQLEPAKIITRREYARWLVAANNAMYAKNPAKQIRLASESVQPAFSDVPKTNPDFGAIQGLAEAGLIPSPLSGDSTAVLFRPDAPLTREQLILWKIPLDTRQALPAANLDTVKQTWGFQDAAKIDPQALRAILADYQNGEKSNIRRVFGYTTLFQPKKPVTRAEAAAALWYFGTLSEGVSAQDALKLKRS